MIKTQAANYYRKFHTKCKACLSSLEELGILTSEGTKACLMFEGYTTGHPPLTIDNSLYIRPWANPMHPPAVHPTHPLLRYANIRNAYVHNETKADHNWGLVREMKVVNWVCKVINIQLLYKSMAYFTL